MLRLLLLLATLLASGCGYIGEPLPPALQIPQRVSDLSAIEHGSEIAVKLTLPEHTTEDLAIEKPVRIELRVGAAQIPFQEQTWAAAAKVWPNYDVYAGRTTRVIPVVVLERTELQTP